jgi:BASS family bile acid:Na+ symporter
MTPLTNLLSLIGRYGTQGFAISIFLGLALPQFAAAARPLLPITIFVFTMITFARVDSGALRELVRRPAPLALACAWLVAAPIALVLGVIAVVGRGTMDPGLLLGLAIMAAAPPIMSAGAVALMLGLQPTLLITAVLVTTLAAPLVSPLIAEFVAGGAVPLDLTVLIRAHKGSFDGLGVVMYFLFAIAAMDGVLAAMIATPGRVAGFLAVAFAMSFAGFLAAELALRALPRSDRFVLGYATGQRNMGLLIAALGAATPDTTFLYFALAQFPIYLMPQLVKPIANRLRAATTGGEASPTPGAHGGR